jgi:hypothetical protein
MKRKIELNEIPNLRLSDGQLKIVEEYKRINEMVPSDLCISYDETELGELIRVEYMYLKFTDYPDINIFRFGFESGYSISSEVTNKLKNIENYSITRIRKMFDVPNNFKVPTKKKLMDWIEYESKVVEACKRYDAEVQKRKDAFLKSLPKVGVSWWSKTQGEIKKGGVVFKFTIGKEYIMQTIEVSASQNLENFLSISKNRYGK